jgi:RNA polymerase sigma factor (sigma-70 family)
MALAWDRNLQVGFRNGHREALEAFYWAHVDDVVRTARAVLRASAADGGGRDNEIASDVADVVQEAFAKAFAPDARRRFDGERSFAPYLLQIARNLAIDHLRAKRRNVPIDVDQLAERLSLDARAADHQATDWADPAMVALVDGYVASLGEDERRIHDALYVLGLSQREAAGQLGLGRQVIRTVEAKLRAGLRRELVRTGFLDGVAAARPNLRTVANRR